MRYMSIVVDFECPSNEKYPSTDVSKRDCNIRRNTMCLLDKISIVADSHLLSHSM